MNQVLSKFRHPNLVILMGCHLSLGGHHGGLKLDLRTKKRVCGKNPRVTPSFKKRYLLLIVEVKSKEIISNLSCGWFVFVLNGRVPTTTQNGRFIGSDDSKFGQYFSIHMNL